MTPLEKHLTKRPQSPGNVGANHPDMIRFHQDFTAWAEEKERLECAERVGKLELPELNRQPACTPRADYEWRDLRGRNSSKRDKQRERWRQRKEAQTPEKKAQIQERRRQLKAERQAKIREGLNQRKVEQREAA